MRALLPWMAALVRVGLGLVGLALCGPAHAATPLGAQQVLERCSHARVPSGSSGIEGLRAVCPGLEQALLDLKLTEQLQPDWRRRINGAAVNGLEQLVERYRGEPPGIAPRVATLPQILRSLHASAPPSWWERFKAWLLTWLRPGGSNTDWLHRLLLRLNLSPALARVLATAIGYAAVALALGLLFWIVRRELRAAGAWASRPARRRTSRASAMFVAQEPGLPDLAAFAPRQRPGALLAALVRVLRQSGRLGLERACTHRELAIRGQFDDPAQRERFQRVAMLAEQALYGAAEASAAPEAPIAHVLADGVALYAQFSAQLSAPPGSPRGPPGPRR
ncbi:MAG TPA: hypothetical protein VIX87_10755 [Steroidobacteraceae bacterium]